MKRYILSLLLLSLLPCIQARALGPLPRQESSSKVVSAPLVRRRSQSGLGYLNKREPVLLPMTEPLFNGYYANLTIGTPGQSVFLQIDTGSSDIWVDASGSQLCSQNPNLCVFGTYDNTTSSSYRYVNSLFVTSYGDRTFAAGDYASETFNFAGTTVKNMEFGLALLGNSTPVMGVGYSSGEAIVQLNQTPYPNLVDQMVSQQLIESPTYSLFLNSIDATSGNILFGGVDLDKFEGTLSTFPLNPLSDGTVNAFFITLTAMSLTTPSGSLHINAPEFPLNVLLDSGTTDSTLPSAMIQPIADALGAQLLNGTTYIFPNCSLRSAAGSVDFVFSGVQYSVPFSELISNHFPPNGSTITINGEPICKLGITVDDSLPMGILGDAFLRSQYVVYDLGNNEVSMAPAKLDSVNSNIQVIPSGKNKVPSATPVPNATILTLSASAPTTAASGAPTSSTGHKSAAPRSSAPLCVAACAGIVSSIVLLFSYL